MDCLRFVAAGHGGDHVPRHISAPGNGKSRVRFGRKSSASLPRAEHPTTAVMKIVHELRNDSSSKSQVLDKYARHIPAEGLMLLVEEVSRLNNWSLVLALFKWLQRNQGRQLIGVDKREVDALHAKLIDAMGKQGQLRLASWIFSQLATSNPPDTLVFNAIIMAHLRCKNVGRALETALGYLGEMKMSCHSCPNLVTYNILARACARAGLVDKAETLFIEMLQRDLSPDVYTFNGIIGAYAQCGLYHEMEYKLREMREHGVAPDLVTFNTLIHAYGTAGDFVKMERTYKTLANASRYKPSVTTFNSMLWSYGQARELGKMEQVLVRMDMAGLGPDLGTFNTLISSYGRAGEFDVMRKCFDKMGQSSTVRPQVSTLDLLLRTYADHGMVEEAEALFVNASKLQIQPAVSSYLILFKAYGEECQLDKMTVLMSKMEQKGLSSGQEFLLRALESYAATNPSANAIVPETD